MEHHIIVGVRVNEKCDSAWQKLLWLIFHNPFPVTVGYKGGGYEGMGEESAECSSSSIRPKPWLFVKLIGRDYIPQLLLLLLSQLCGG